MVIGVILLFFIGIFIFMLIAFPVAFAQHAKATPFVCPACGREIKLVANTAKCPKCKTKLFKHADGTYRLRT